MASGMGQPSMGIYSYELFNFYGVENIIRVGSCGSYDKDLHLNDIVIALGACSNGNYGFQFGLSGNFCPIADYGLVKKAEEECGKLGVNYKVGNVLSSDVFYDETDSWKCWAKMGVLGVEMEAAALYMNAARSGKRALAICSVSDSFIRKEENMPAEDRQEKLTNMIKVALEIA